MPRSLSFVVLTLLMAASSQAWAQAVCDAPQVLIVLDQSSSMGERAPLADGTLKWDAAVPAITELTTEYESNVHFGLMLFPHDGECTPGTIDVPVGPLHGDAIVSTLGPPPPLSGFYTPMAASLSAAAEYEALQDPDRRSFIALITDGWEWCDPYDATTRFDPLVPAETLADAGVPIFVIGFGDGVDSLLLNRMAVIAGTDLAACDATSDDPSRADNCYHQVDDVDGLRAVLDEIARSVTEEICDGLDNDCDGEVDEGLRRDCRTECGTGTEGCVDGEWANCDAPISEAEICDGVDNDCDGTTDEGCLCENGETMPCGSDEGECSRGTQTCEGGSWGDCEGDRGPASETCDGRDNDCDGSIDEYAECGDGFECVSGACVDVSPEVPDDGGDEGGPEPETDPPGDPSGGGGDPTGNTGCACRLAPSGGGLAGTALLGALLLGFARRLRRD